MVSCQVRPHEVWIRVGDAETDTPSSQDPSLEWAPLCGLNVLTFVTSSYTINRDSLSPRGNIQTDTWVLTQYTKTPFINGWITLFKYCLSFWCYSVRNCVNLKVLVWKGHLQNMPYGAQIWQILKIIIICFNYSILWQKNYDSSVNHYFFSFPEFAKWLLIKRKINNFLAVM